MTLRPHTQDDLSYLIPVAERERSIGNGFRVGAKIDVISRGRHRPHELTIVKKEIKSNLTRNLIK